MNIEVRPLHPIFAAEVLGFDFSKPVSEMPLDTIRAASARYGVLVFRNERPPSDEQHIAFSKALGPIEGGKLIKVSGYEARRLKPLELVDVGNLDINGNILKPDSRQMMFRLGDRLWHSDMSFMDNRATWSLLLGHEIPPEGGDTDFADTRHAHEQLPKEMRQMIDGLTVEHSIWHSRQIAGFPEPTAEEIASRPPVQHKLVHVHGPSQRKALYVASHASHVAGWPVQLGRGLLGELMKFTTQPEFFYRHKWRLGDLVMWDNLATVHRATEFEDTKYKRDMRRTTCRERAPEERTAA